MNMFTTVHPEGEIEYDFNENRIVGIMLKVAQTFNPDFKPREISLTSGNPIPAFSSDADIALPQIGEGRQSTAHFMKFAQQVAKQIGECIDGGLEAAYASGHHFVTSYGRIGYARHHQDVPPALTCGTSTLRIFPKISRPRI